MAQDTIMDKRKISLTLWPGIPRLDLLEVLPLAVCASCRATCLICSAKTCYNRRKLKVG